MQNIKAITRYAISAQLCLHSSEDQARCAVKIKFKQKIRKSTIFFKIMATQQDSLRKSEEA